MAKNDTEIEIKTPVSQKVFRRIEKYLEINLNFVKDSHQVDTYYSPPGLTFLKPDFPFEWLSVRERGGTASLNYKHWYPEGYEVTTHCDEFETKIDNPDQIGKILAALKFKKLVAVEKERKIYVKNDLEIALDRVKNLGWFIEIESLENKGGVEKTRLKLLSFAKKLGIKRFVNVPGGYASALMRKRGLLK